MIRWESQAPAIERLTFLGTDKDSGRSAGNGASATARDAVMNLLFTIPRVMLP